MKKLIFSLSLLMASGVLFAQEDVKKDSIKSTILEEVIIKGVRVKKNDPVTHSNINKKELEKRNLGQDIPVLMNYLPSVITSSDAGAGVGYTYMRVRGSDGSRINMTINGIPYNDAESQGAFLVNISDFASSAESIQLQRGVGTSTNGSGAFGASINILTNNISEKANGEISNSFGSYGTRKHTVKYSTGKMNDHFEIAGRLSKIHSDGYIDRASSDLQSYFIQGSYSDENTIVKGIIFGGKEKTYQAWHGIDANQLKENRRQNPYTYDNETDNYWQDHYQLHLTQQLTNNLSANIGLNYTKGKGYYEQEKLSEDIIIDSDGDHIVDLNKFQGIIIPTKIRKEEYEEKGVKKIMEIPVSDLIVRRWLDNDFYVMNFNANYKKNNLDIIAGTSFSFYEGDHFGEVIWAREFAKDSKNRDNYYFNDASKTDQSVFAKATFNITNELIGFIDLQGRFINYKNQGIDNDQGTLAIKRDFNFFNPKAGLTYKINNQNSIYCSYARANREPNRSDLKSNPNTKHETLNDFELGWRYDTEKIKVNTNVYYMGYENQLVLTGELNDVGGVIRANSGTSYRAGIELDATFNVNNKLFIRPNFAYNYHRNVDYKAQIDGKLENLGNTPISFSPDFIAGNIITYAPVKNLQLSLLSKFVGEQYMSNLEGHVIGEAYGVPYNDKLDSYFTSDVNVTYEIKPKKIFKSIVLSGLVNNIFNEKYVDRGYFGTYDIEDKSTRTTLGYSGYYPQATTNFLAGLTLKF